MKGVRGRSKGVQITSDAWIVGGGEQGGDAVQCRVRVLLCDWVCTLFFRARGLTDPRWSIVLTLVHAVVHNLGPWLAQCVCMLSLWPRARLRHWGCSSLSGSGDVFFFSFATLEGGHLRGRAVYGRHKMEGPGWICGGRRSMDGGALLFSVGVVPWGRWCFERDERKV